MVLLEFCGPFIYRILCLAKSTVSRNLLSVETQVCKFISTALTADGCCVILSEMPSNRYKLLLLKYGLLSTHPQQNQPSLIKQHCTNWRTVLITFLLARILTHCTCFTVNAFIIKQIGRRMGWLPEFYELLGYIILISHLREMFEHHDFCVPLHWGISIISSECTILDLARQICLYAGWNIANIYALTYCFVYLS